MFRMHPTNQLKMLLCACRLRRLHSRQNENSHLQPIAAASSTEKEIYKTVVCAQLEFTLLSTKSLYLSLSLCRRAPLVMFLHAWPVYQSLASRICMRAQEIGYMVTQIVLRRCSFCILLPH